jgi:hypothetical protein
MRYALLVCIDGDRRQCQDVEGQYAELAGFQDEMEARCVLAQASAGLVWPR